MNDIMKITAKDIFNREVSWLSFNERVLQEAADPSVPLVERIKFLGIFSNNLDEFFRVRIANVRRLIKLQDAGKKIQNEDPKKLLKKLLKIIKQLQEKFAEIYYQLFHELKKENIFVIDERSLSHEQGLYVKEYFHSEVRPTIMPIMLDGIKHRANLKDHSIYLAVHLINKKDPSSDHFALIEIPTKLLPRLVILPSKDEKNFIIMLDDIIRYCLADVFSIFKFDQIEAYTFKITRDSELDIEENVLDSFVEKISKSLKRRLKGIPVRFIYDEQMSKTLLDVLIKKLNLGKESLEVVQSFTPSSRRYHNFKDFIKFPNFGLNSLVYPSLPPIPHKDIDLKKSLLSQIKKRDFILHYPYHSFHYFIDLLREASIDPKVTSIKIIIYRLAKNSNVAGALINAAKNGKMVTAVIELRARFDEEANINWVEKLEEEGVHVVPGVPSMKVHGKLCLITRKEGTHHVRYACSGTGNFNEETANLYTDSLLLTSHKEIASEINKVFKCIENSNRVFKFEHLLVSPYTTRDSINSFIDTEIKNAHKGKPAYIFLKLNNLVDQQVIEKLYEASQAGVKIHLIIRGICSLRAGVSGLSENIEAISIVDRFLEHSRFFIFANGGKERYFLSSADWMYRNISNRIEVTCPIYDPKLQQEIKEMLNILWSDNTKVRILDKNQTNQFKETSPECVVRAQLAIYDYFKKKQPQ
ncbi:MAG: polyphosphate kinase [bacterium]|jgi:polyphosphate kinase